MTRPDVCCLMGPTACGKTAAALEIHGSMPGSLPGPLLGSSPGSLSGSLSGRGGFDLISVDSAMVYRGMDIGTAKPSPETLARHPHALVDILEPHQPFSAADFVIAADREVRAGLEAHRTPLLVGGTMLYFHAFKHGINAMPTADQTVRERLAARAEAEGWDVLHAELTRLDPVAGARIHPANRQRIARALEVFEITGKPISSFWEQPSVGAEERLQCNLVELAIVPPDRAVLHQRIEERVDRMLEGGLVDEVRTLRETAGLHENLPAMRAVGYRQTWRFLDGAYDRDELRHRIIAATRQLAKKQLTWLRGWEGHRTVENWHDAGLSFSRVMGS